MSECPNCARLRADLESAEERERELEARLNDLGLTHAQALDRVIEAGTAEGEAVLRAERAEEALAAANEALREIADGRKMLECQRIARAALVATGGEGGE